MKRMFTFGIVVGSIALLLVLFSPPVAPAQCAQCKANVEAASKDPNNRVGRGLNGGILYLLAVPYLLAGTVAVLWYRNYRRNKLNHSAQ
jgi:hypothetical protein